MAKILIIYHSQTGNTEKLAQAVASGAKQAGAEVILKKADQATVKDILYCDILAIGSPNYFSYMAGTIKDFFDRIYYEAKDKIDNKPYAVFVTHGGGGELPVIESLDRIARSFNLKKVLDPFSVFKEPQESDLKKAGEFGKKLASLKLQN